MKIKLPDIKDVRKNNDRIEILVEDEWWTFEDFIDEVINYVWDYYNDLYNEKCDEKGIDPDGHTIVWKIGTLKW